MPCDHVEGIAKVVIDVVAVVAWAPVRDVFPDVPH